MSKFRLASSFGAVVAIVVGTLVLTGLPGSAGTRSVTANLRGPDRVFTGKVTFTNSRQHPGQTDVELRLDRAPTIATALDAFHGFHIHANGDPTNGDGCVADATAPSSTWFVSADGHWSMAPAGHGSHSGDMPSVLINPDGTASLRFVTARTKLDDLVGRAVVLHAGPDNFNNVPVGSAADQYTANSAAAVEKTQKTGNAGDRIACGVINR